MNIRIVVLFTDSKNPDMLLFSTGDVELVSELSCVLGAIELVIEYTSENDHKFVFANQA